MAILGTERFSRFCALAGFVMGLFISLLNIIKINIFLITIGTALSLSSIIYLIWGNKLKCGDKYIKYSKTTIYILNISYYLIVSAILLKSHGALYTRDLEIFIFTVIGVVLLGIEILGNQNAKSIILKILLLSIVFRASDYFINPYPLGSDPWAHIEYVKNFIAHGHLIIDIYPPGIGMENYYCLFPIFHLMISTIILLLNISINNAFFLISILLVISTIFVYLISYIVTYNKSISFFVVLLINFADYHIQWGIQIIAMTYGLIVFCIIIYLALKEEVSILIYKIILILSIFILIWTHTISAFISFALILSLYVVQKVYKFIFKEIKPSSHVVSLYLCVLFAVLLLLHWMEPSYAFINSVIIGIKKALLSDATFITGAIPFDKSQFIGSIGFICYLFLYFIGIYKRLEYRNEKTYILIAGGLSLVTIIVLFMAFGLNNIIPSRWWAFIYIIMVIFTGWGLMYFIGLFKRELHKAVFVSLFLGITSFIMVTNHISNYDTPLYASPLKLSWTHSEMMLFKDININYNQIIFADLQTAMRPFNTYFKRYDCTSYPLTDNKQINWREMQRGMVVWTRDSIYKKVQLYRDGKFELLGSEYKNSLDKNFNCVSDTYGARAYLGLDNIHVYL